MLTGYRCWQQGGKASFTLKQILIFYAFQHKGKLISGKVIRSYKCDTTPRSSGTQSKKTLTGGFISYSIIKQEKKRKTNQKQRQVFSNLLFHDVVIKVIY